MGIGVFVTGLSQISSFSLNILLTLTSDFKPHILLCMYKWNTNPELQKWGRSAIKEEGRSAMLQILQGVCKFAIQHQHKLYHLAVRNTCLLLYLCVAKVSYPNWYTPCRKSWSFLGIKPRLSIKNERKFQPWQLIHVCLYMYHKNHYSNYVFAINLDFAHRCWRMQQCDVKFLSDRVDVWKQCR